MDVKTNEKEALKTLRHRWRKETVIEKKKYGDRKRVRTNGNSGRRKEQWTVQYCMCNCHFESVFV